MNDIHVICLYALLGNRTFADMMKSVFNMKLDGLDGDFLVRLKHEKYNKKNCDAKRRKVVDRNELEKRVSIGEKLDAADEAKLSKLSAARESNRKYNREKLRRKVVDRNELEKRVSIGDKVDAADEAMLSKLTAAHESKKKMIVIDYEKKG
jgi:hypothetical protein